jgi:hypothetical protein
MNGSLQGPTVDKLRSLLLLTINGVVLLNACLHDPTVGYDAPSHIRYFEVLSTLRWPRPPEVYEFFSPPLPYAFPALLVGAFGLSPWWAAKCAQFLNVALSVILTRSLLRLCDSMRPGDPRFGLTALLCLAIVPAYYRTFAFFRGEPFVATVGVLAAREAFDMIQRGVPRHGAARLGGFLGLAALSRQWGFGLWAGTASFLLVQAIARADRRNELARSLATSIVIASLVAGGFYLYLIRSYGTPKAFNRLPASTLALGNQPSTFYLGLDLGALVRDPIRPSSPNRLPTILYADFWGDYWAYFVVYARDVERGCYLFGADFEAATTNEPEPTGIESNRRALAGYLGRNDLLGLLPSALFLVGLIAGACQVGPILRGSARSREADGRLLSALLVLASLALFLWFLIMYPDPTEEGDTVKASYMIQCVPFLALLGGDRLTRIGDRSSLGLPLALVGLGLILAHNLPAAVTRYVVR